MSTVVGGLDRIGAVFDDGSVVGDGGLVLAGTLVGRLGLEGLVGEAVRPPGAGRGSGAKVLAAVCSMLVGGSFFSDADRLRAGSAGAVVGFAPVAPSTLGTFARSFAWGRVRRLDRVGSESPHPTGGSGFSAAPLLSERCAPLVLSEREAVPGSTAAFLDNIRAGGDIATFTVFGGNAAITAGAIESYLEPASRAELSAVPGEATLTPHLGQVSVSWPSTEALEGSPVAGYEVQWRPLGGVWGL
ncbi:hypothetical protein [Candidatus Poriferisodalis sp.]|uniref:hypothetical protein n=1 Tax=Candidatus Poriferisodalis sp. TaxID=3101277 RepID=UPI003B01F163